MNSIAMLFLGACAAVFSAASPVETVRFAAADGATVVADVHPAAAGKAAPVVLLFHQMEGNAAEYAPIVPRLAEAGFTCIVPDLRGGGDRFGEKSRNPGTKGADLRVGFHEGYADMSATAKWARENGYTGKTVAWGSSYSAGMVFQLAKENPHIAAVLSFSPPPAEFVPNLVTEGLEIPVLVTNPPSEVERKKALVGSLRFPKLTVLAQEKGTHGSSTLRPDTNAEGCEAIWKDVLAFLKAAVA